MAKENRSFPIFMLAGYVFILTLYLIQIARTRGLQFTTIFMAIMIILFSWVTTYGTFFIDFKGKGFVALDGVKGTIIGSPKPESDDRVTYNVCFQKGYINKEILKRRRGGMNQFFDMMHGTVTIPVTDRASNFVDMESNYCSDPRGCVKYLGSVNNLPLEPIEQIRIQKSRELLDGIVTLKTILNSRENQANLLSQQENKVFAKVSQQLKSLTSNLKGQQNVIIPGQYQPPQQ